MTALRHRLLDTNGDPVAGRTATVADYTGVPGRFTGYRRTKPISAVSDDDGWLTWELPRSKTGTYVVTGIEAQQVLVSVQPGVSTATVTEVRTGTVPATPETPTTTDLVTESELSARLAGITRELAAEPSLRAAFVLPKVGGYTYNPDGSVASGPDGETYAYNTDGTVHSVTLNGVTRIYSYDANLNVTAVA